MTRKLNKTCILITVCNRKLNWNSIGIMLPNFKNHDRDDMVFSESRYVLGLVRQRLAWFLIS